MRALCRLPGCIGSFIPGSIGSNHSRLRHVGWQKCCHGLTCRPLKTSGEGVLSDLLSLLGYPAGSGTALLGGTLGLNIKLFPSLGGSLPGRFLCLGRWPIFLLLVAIILTMGVMCSLWVVVSLVKVVKGSDLLRRHQFWGGSLRPIPGGSLHDPGYVGDPGTGRRVSRRCLGSNPGDRLDRNGIG